MRGFKLALVATAVLALSGAAGAYAKPTDPNEAKIDALVADIKATLANLGCTSSYQQDKAAIQTDIANSGLTPDQVELALRQVQATGGLCSDAASALASISNTIEFAFAKYPAAPASGGPPGQSGYPIGGPPAFLSGSDYVSRGGED